ncbi:MAG: DUF1501 domain-containing protein [Bacteroidota bacterium]
MCNHQSNKRHGASLEHGHAHSKDHEFWSRRSFLASIGMASAGATMMLGSTPIQAFSNSKILRRLGALETNRALVLIQLNGGNDGLNTVVPFEDDVYNSLRPTIRISKNQIQTADSILFNDFFGLHPAMNALTPMWGTGDMAVVHNVGYEESSRSHFRGTDIWATASDEDVNLNTGWIGRFLTEENPDFLATPTEYPLGVRIGGTSLLFQSDFGNLGMTFGGSSQFDAFLEQGGFYDEDNLPANSFGEALKQVRKVTNASFRYVEAVQNAANGVGNLVEYPNSGLARSLSSVARLIRGQLRTRIYLVSIGGFDTHSNQGGEEGNHANLLRNISEAVTSFYEDLGTDDLAEEVLTMTFSEFGRTLNENGSNGTDHGSAAPLFLFGPSVNGGVFGPEPDLTQLDRSGDPLYSTDYRKVYNTVLQRWFGLESNQSNDVLGAEFGDFDFVQSVPVSNEPSTSLPGRIQLRQNYPNPFNPTTIIGFSLPRTGQVRLRVYNSNGQLVQTLLNGTVQAGAHEVMFNASGLPSGVYIYKIETPQGSQSQKMTLIK